MKPMKEISASELLSDEVLSEVFDTEDEILKARLILSLTERAEELGIKTKFNQLLRAYKKEAKKMGLVEAEKRQKISDSNICFDYFDDGRELNCGSWVLDGERIIEYNRFGMINVACSHLIIPVKILKNAETEKESVTIAYRKKFIWKEFTVPRGVLASATKILQLADYGVAVTSENARYLVRYLADVEALNQYKIECKTSTGKLGWVRNEFMPYGFDIEIDNKAKYKELFESVSEHGSYEKWLELVKKIRISGRKEPLVYLAGSFGSILLKPLSILPFIINLWAESGKGKTVALMLATSVWANPEEGKYMTDSTSTQVAMEIREDILNNLPMALDDLSKMRDKYGDSFTDLIYYLCGGKGKDRSNVELGLNQAKTWQNIILTNMERPLATETMRGGAINRILDFEMEDGSIFPNGNEVVKVLKSNYGFAGREFVECVKEIGFEAIYELQQEYLEKIRLYCIEHDCEKEDKQIIPMSVLFAADKIAADYIFKDGVYLDFEWCIRQLKGKEEVSENERAYEFIMSDVAVNINKFKPDSTGEYRGEVWGVIEDGYVIIINNVFNNMCQRGNFSNRAFLNWASKRGLIQCQSGKNSKNKRINGGLSRCIWIKIPDEFETDEDGFMSLDGTQEELPFE